jgi:hypothetical protein
MAYIMIPIIIGIFAGVITTLIDKDPLDFFVGFVIAGLVSGFFSLVFFIGNYESNVSNERLKICTEKGGIVQSSTYLCMVDGKPVEYSPGKWEYDR